MNNKKNTFTKLPQINTIISAQQVPAANDIKALKVVPNRATQPSSAKSQSKQTHLCSN